MTSNDANREECCSLLGAMWLIRAFEEKVSELHARGKIGGLLHLAIGQEGVAVGAISVLNSTDYVFSGHRPHAHALAKGADPGALMAELAGRATGYCRGKGGSMHISAMDVGFVTATGIVGGNIPLALGAALTCRERGEGAVAMAFFGDGAGQTGGFHESLNIASLWKLPMVFLCENNGYAEFTPLSEHTLVERLADYSATYGIPRVTVEGNDVLGVREAVEEAVTRARGGGGPSFVECLTYRLRGHYEGDPGKYRDNAELEDWKSKDPIRLFEAMLAERGTISEQDARDLEKNARRTMEEAAETALAAPWPAPEELTRQVFVGD